MAEGIARKLIKSRTISNVQVESAGVSAVEGLSVSPDALEAMNNRGIDLSGHRSKRFDPSIGPDDIILAMTRAHRDRIINDHPQLAGRVYTLAGYAKGADDDIPDPFTGEVSYGECVDVIEENVTIAVDKVARTQAKG
jgi:protein-tyrosine phosphatase